MSGKREWKKAVEGMPPQPERQVSLENTASGDVHGEVIKCYKAEENVTTNDGLS